VFAIEINFLTGRYVATSHYNRSLPEWPPHPARLFSAMVAEWAVDQDPSEREALEWLEAQSPPSITASDEYPRTVVKHFVPVNDSAIVSKSAYRNKLGRVQNLEKSYQAEIDAFEGEVSAKLERIQEKINKELNVDNLVNPLGTTATKSAEEMLPEGRVKQERFFPSVRPEKPRVTFTWNTVPQAEVSEVLDKLISRITRIGHSSSLVSCRIITQPPPPRLIPSTTGESLRGIALGQLQTLEREFDKHKGIKPRSLPYVQVRYREFEEPKPGLAKPNNAGSWQVFALNLNSRSVPSTQTAEITKVFRGAVFKHAQDPIPEGLTGHQTNGAPSKLPHVGFYTLPWIGHEHSDGRIMGVALNIPDSLDNETIQAVYRAINNWEKGQGPTNLSLYFSNNTNLTIQRLTTNSDLATLRPRRWRKESLKWVTATPIALPIHPGKLAKGTSQARTKAWKNAEESVVKSCLHVGLPEPSYVTVSFDPFILGARPAPQYPAFSQTGADGQKISRKLVHAAITFDTPVSGPLALGAGRFLGLGLMIPVVDRNPKNSETPGSEKNSDPANNPSEGNTLGGNS